MEFQRYRKSTPITARPLTEADYQACDGLIATSEGPAPFAVGDYLARDMHGQWPIPRAKMEQHYRLLRTKDDGWQEWECLDVREACQMTEAFEAGGLTGEAGDYLVRGNGGMSWPCAWDVFEASYKLVR